MPVALRARIPRKAAGLEWRGARRLWRAACRTDTAWLQALRVGRGLVGEYDATCVVPPGEGGARRPQGEVPPEGEEG